MLGKICSVFWTGLLSLVLCQCAPDQRQIDAEAEQYIIKSEGEWAESVASGNTAVIERILADDFVGVDPKGNLYDKAKMVADTREAPKHFVSNHLNRAKVRFYGDMAVVQGEETWERRIGQPRRGRFVWTDTWLRRDGRWQIIAAEDVSVPEGEATPPSP